MALPSKNVRITRTEIGRREISRNLAGLLQLGIGATSLALRPRHSVSSFISAASFQYGDTFDGKSLQHGDLVCRCDVLQLVSGTRPFRDH